jgi:hypothetical protein
MEERKASATASTTTSATARTTASATARTTASATTKAGSLGEWKKEKQQQR